MLLKYICFFTDNKNMKVTMNEVKIPSERLSMLEIELEDQKSKEKSYRN